MIDHVSVAVSDLSRSTCFYEAVLGAIGYAPLDVRGSTVGFGKTYSEFWLNARPEMAPLPAHPGAHVCLRVRSTNWSMRFTKRRSRTAAAPTVHPARARMTGRTATMRPSSATWTATASRR